MKQVQIQVIWVYVNVHRRTHSPGSLSLAPATYLLQMARTLITEPRTRRAEMVTTVTTTAGLWSLDSEVPGRKTKG